MATRDPSALETYDRLLAAASEVFCEVGYRQATLREICRRAKANVAAVNYYFRDKEQLYHAVLERAVQSCESLAQIDPKVTDSPEDKLRYFVRVLLDNMLGVDRPLQLLRLVAHELVEPTPALDLVIEKAVRPLNEIGRTIIAELLGPAATPEVVRDCTGSMFGQCAAYDHSQAVIQRLDHLDVHDPATIERLAEHVFQFSLGGIRAIAASHELAHTSEAR
jgi:TetR/AcrR family transcriptional regulator, regulator of cefoperazone and chloramphenicol sensitivity